jgi:uncharacterized protein
MAPVRPRRRIVVVDILRGLAVLGILLVNMLSFSGYFYTPTSEMGAADRLATLLIQFVAQAKFYTLFSFLFGWGMAIQMRRAAQGGKSFGRFYVRRLIILLLIGLVHAILIWEGDILVNYALLGLPLLLFRKRSPRTILVVAVVCVLIPVLLSTPGPAEAVREWHAGLVAPLRRQMMEGHHANVYVEGSYLEVTVHRAKAAGFGYASFVYWAPHIFGMFLLGLFVGRRRLFTDISAHLSLFRRVMWSGLIVGLACNLIFVAASDSPDLFPLAYRELATRGARTIAGSALSLFYISGVVLLTQKRQWMARLSPLAFVGRTALSNYLFQSVVCTLLFYGYGVGLYRKLGPAITIFLTLLLFRVQIGLSTWWLERYRFGPAEWLWRSLTYGPQPWKAEPGQSIRIAGASNDWGEDRGAVLNGVTFVLQRLTFIAAVGFAIVYFCTVGLRLSGNSRLPVGQQRRSVWDVANPALEETMDFFEDLSRGDLGRVAPDVSGRDWQPVMQVLATAYGDSARLLIVAVGLAAVIGIAAGAIAAARRHSVLALPMLTVTVVGISIPSFFLALLIQIGSIAFYRRTGIRLVLFGSHLPGAKSLLPKMALPALVLVARPLAHITRVTFVSLSEVLEQDYVRTARAKGLREILVFGNHVLRNAGVRILTAVVVSFRFALGSLPVAEIFFDWPGLGVTMLNGIFQRQSDVVAGAALGLGVTFLLINMSLDLIYRVIDPRLRTQSNGGAL